MAPSWCYIYSLSIFERFPAFTRRGYTALCNAVGLNNNGPVRYLKTAAAKKDEDVKNQVKIKESPVQQITREPLLNWPAYKRSWKHFTKYRSQLLAVFTFKKETHDGRLRYQKKSHVIYYFRTKKDLDYWYVMTDEAGGGHSWAELTSGYNGMTALFRGYLNQRKPANFAPKNDYNAEMESFYNGTVYLETKPFFTFLDKREFMTLEPFNCIKIRLRGDGRRYNFEISSDAGFHDRIVFFYPIFTRGGPLWEEVEIPLMKLLARNEDTGRGLLKQAQMDPTEVELFRFLLNDRNEGPFQLEIDYIALSHNPKYPYEALDAFDPWEPINSASGN